MQIKIIQIEFMWKITMEFPYFLQRIIHLETTEAVNLHLDAHRFLLNYWVCTAHLLSYRT